MRLAFQPVSATFMIIVAKTLGLMPHWNLYFWITLVITFVVTAITAWLPPITNESTEYYNGQEGEQEVAIPGNTENCICRGDETKCINTISREERLGQFERRFRNDCWYFTFYIIDWFFRTDCSELYTIH